MQSISTGSNDTLSITGGSLMVTSGTSTLSGALSMSGGSLTATGSGVSLTANGTTTVADASLYAKNGATLSLPQMTSYTADGNVFQADGSGSLLDVSALATTTLKADWTIDATTGGTLQLTGLTSLGDSSTQSFVNINDTGKSALLDSNVKTLDRVNATLDGTDAQAANSWTQLTNGQLNITGGSYDMSGLTDVDGSSLYVSNGGQLALPGLTSYATNETYFSAEGSGSVLDVSALTTLKKAIFYPEWYIVAASGGTVNLTGMTSFTGPTSGDGEKGYISIIDTGGSSLLLNSKLTTLDSVQISLDGTDTQVVNSWTTFTNGTLKISGGSYNLPGLTDIDGSGVEVSDGASVSLPGVTSYASQSGGPDLEATGTGSNLTLANLKSITGTGSLTIDALAGGTENLSALTQINTTGYYGWVEIESDGAGSLLDISNLATFARSGAQNSMLQITNGGTLKDGSLTTLNYVNVWVDGTGTSKTLLTIVCRRAPTIVLLVRPVSRASAGPRKVRSASLFVPAAGLLSPLGCADGGAVTNVKSCWASIKRITSRTSRR